MSAFRLPYGEFVIIIMQRKTQKELNPFPYSDSNKRYHTMDYYMRKLFGKKACKIPIDGGFTCPNRDGSCGVGGCTFCSSKGSGEFTAGRELSISAQIEKGAEMMHRKWKDAALIPYFQSFTGTYAPIDKLKALYIEALSHPLSSGLCIATRADCITDEVSKYLHEIAKDNFLMLELGLQSVHDKTALAINRGHTFEDFLCGYEKVKDLFVCIHLINGLPHESREMMLESAKAVASLRPSAVKVHLLHIIKGTAIAEQYERGEFSEMSLCDYVETVCDQLEVLPPETVIERVTGDGVEADLIAPLWSKKKLVVQNEIDKELYTRESWQGKLFQNKIRMSKI